MSSWTMAGLGGGPPDGFAVPNLPLEVGGAVLPAGVTAGERSAGRCIGSREGSQRRPADHYFAAARRRDSSRAAEKDSGPGRSVSGDQKRSSRSCRTRITSLAGMRWWSLSGNR